MVVTEQRPPELFRCPTNDGKDCLDSFERLTDTDFAAWQGDILPDYYYRYASSSSTGVP
ncbi:MAG: hypothetical protein R2848_16950 [Thermomicrobiales bacterium]